MKSPKRKESPQVSVLIIIVSLVSPFHSAVPSESQDDKSKEELSACINLFQSLERYSSHKEFPDLIDRITAGNSRPLFLTVYSPSGNRRLSLIHGLEGWWKDHRRGHVVTVFLDRVLNPDEAALSLMLGIMHAAEPRSLIRENLEKQFHPTRMDFDALLKMLNRDAIFRGVPALLIFPEADRLFEDHKLRPILKIILQNHLPYVHFVFETRRREWTLEALYRDHPAYRFFPRNFVSFKGLILVPQLPSARVLSDEDTLSKLVFHPSFQRDLMTMRDPEFERVVREALKVVATDPISGKVLTTAGFPKDSPYFRRIRLTYNNSPYRLVWTNTYGRPFILAVGPRREIYRTLAYRVSGGNQVIKSIYDQLTKGLK